MAQADIITNEESSRLVRAIADKTINSETDAQQFKKLKNQYDEAGYITSHQLNYLRELFVQLSN